MHKTLLATILILAASIGPAHARDLNVVASFTILADMTTHVGGTHVHVRSLVGPNGDPHTYEPAPADAAALANADLIIVNGLDLEGWMDRLISASGTRAVVVVASKGISIRTMTVAGRQVPDPHAWNCAANGALYALNIAAALIAADPRHAPDYRSNAARYAAQLRQLDAWARRAIGAIPAGRRRIITSHDAFGYLGAAYGMDFLAPVGLSTQAEASAAAVARLIDQIKAEKIRTVFLENSNDAQLLRQIASATGARLGGTLYAEALSAADGPAPTYARMFRYNIGILVQAMRVR